MCDTCQTAKQAKPVRQQRNERRIKKSQWQFVHKMWVILFNLKREWKKRGKRTTDTVGKIFMRFSIFLHFQFVLYFSISFAFRREFWRMKFQFESTFSCIFVFRILQSLQNKQIGIRLVGVFHVVVYFSFSGFHLAVVIDSIQRECKTNDRKHMCSALSSSSQAPSSSQQK